MNIIISSGFFPPQCFARLRFFLHLCRRCPLLFTPWHFPPRSRWERIQLKFCLSVSSLSGRFLPKSSFVRRRLPWLMYLQGDKGRKAESRTGREKSAEHSSKLDELDYGSEPHTEATCVLASIVRVCAGSGARWGQVDGVEPGLIQLSWTFEFPHMTVGEVKCGTQWFMSEGDLCCVWADLTFQSTLPSAGGLIRVAGL